MRGIVLPSLRRPLPRVAVVIDTSGSMGEAEIASALGEVTGVLREVGVRGNRVTVLACDADVQAVSRVTSTGQITLGGGGGTDMRVGITAALAGPERPGIVIVLTDGLTPWPDETPSSPARRRPRRTVRSGPSRVGRDGTRHVERSPVNRSLTSRPARVPDRRG